MNVRLLSVAAACVCGLVLSLAPGSAAAQVIECESREYQYQFCPTPDGVQRARLIDQQSRVACVEGRNWGHDRRGIWVSAGCAGRFEYQGFRPTPGPPPGAQLISCESREYRQEFCPTPDTIVGATMVRQKSRTPCVQGQNWGWRANGIWVSGGCDADFELRTSHQPGPLPGGAGRIVCESHDSDYQFCPTGRIRNAQVVNQISRAPCVEGQSWGVSRDGIWVDRGCRAEFRISGR